jgi:predicted DNA-binding antitoxin AbrB/MazE fold protein
LGRPNIGPFERVFSGARERGNAMGKTVHARFSKGVIEPLEKVDIAEGRELLVTILLELPPPSSEREMDYLDATAGAWKDSIDCEELKRNIYADRLIPSGRPEVKFDNHLPD